MAEARQRRMGQAGAWLVSVGGGAAPGELGAALGLHGRHQAEVIGGLRKAGLVTGSQRRIMLTAEGWARFAVAEVSGAGRLVDEAVAGWPFAHAAYGRLMVSAVVARRHLAETRTSGHPGFMALGESGTGKTSIVEYVVAPLIGVDASAIREVPAEPPGALSGRVERVEGGRYRRSTQWVPGPLVCFDEFDKGDEAQQRACLPWFQGRTVTVIDGERIERPCVPVLTANPPRLGSGYVPVGDERRYRVLQPAYRRRSVVLDTGYAATPDGRARIAGLVRQAIQRPPVRLPVEDLRPPQQLDARGLAVLETITRVLTDAGADELDRAGLELLALGRAALLGTDDHALAAYATAADYLNVAGTVPGLVVDGWQAEAAAVRGWFAAGGDVDRLVAELERARAEREQAKAAGRRAVLRREIDDDELTAERATLAARLARLADSIEGRRLGVLADEQRDAAKGVRAVLLNLRRQVLDCRSRTRLAELTDRAAEPLHVAESIAQAAAREKARRADEKHRAAREAAEQKRQAERGRVLARQTVQARRARLGEVLAAVVEQARPLEALYQRTVTRPAENPLDELRELEVNGRPLVTFSPDPHQTRGLDAVLDVLGAVGAAVARVDARPAPGPRRGRAGTWQVTGTRHVFSGYADHCPALAAWGDNTRAVLAPALSALHATEDQIRIELGKKARQTRPRIEAVTGRAMRPALASVGFHNG